MTVLALLLLQPVTATATPAGTTAPSAAQLDAFVQQQVDRAGVPGAAYAVVGPRGVEHQAYLGVDGDGADVAADTTFLWGSVAKPVTATLLVLMADTGELDLDRPVVQHLPQLRTADRAASDRITLRQLLNHTSGIPERLDLTDGFDADRRPGDVVAQLQDTELVAQPGVRHTYSSINYVLLAAVVEEVTGRPFSDVLIERVLAPLGMSTAITTAEQAQRRLPPGHRYIGGRAEPFTTQYDPAGLSSGYLGGTLDDATAFVRAYLPGGPLLTPASRGLLTASGAATGPGQTYGLGWRTWQVPGSTDRMVWHGGAVPGYSTATILLPDQDRAIVVLQNAYGPFQESTLLDTGWGLASLLSGVTPQHHETDVLYPTLLITLGTLTVALLTLGGMAVRGIRRPRTQSRRGVLLVLTAWCAGLAAVTGALFILPSQFGLGLTQLILWAPDIAYLLLAGLALAITVALLRVTVALRTHRHSRTARRA